MSSTLDETAEITGEFPPPPTQEELSQWCYENRLVLRVKKLQPQAQLPVRASVRAAGYDLFAAHGYTIAPHGKEKISTEISLAVPPGYYGRIAPRSSLAWKNHINVGAGVIDSDYRGPVDVVLFNHSGENFVVNVGDRIAQLIITSIGWPTVEEVDKLDSTERGQGGFGSTGTGTIALAPTTNSSSTQYHDIGPPILL